MSSRIMTVCVGVAAIAALLGTNSASAVTTYRTRTAVHGTREGLATTPVSGVISSNTEWTLANSPYVLVGDVGVDTGVTLTIDAGVVVQAQGNYALQVAGRVLAQGTQSQAVSFTCITPVEGCWSGIEFTDSESGSVLDHVDVAYASTGINAPDRGWSLSDSRIHDNGTGIDASGGPTSPHSGTITHNYIDHNQTGVNIFFRLGTFDLNTVTNNGVGLSLLGMGDQLEDNNILGNSVWNADACFFSDSSYVVDASEGWWGTTDQAQISASICDHSDNVNMPTITFTPFLAGAAPGTPQLLSVSTAGSGGGGVVSSPAGINCGATCTAMFDSGTMVTLTATPNGTSRFAGWSGSGCSGTGTCQVTMNAASSLTATFIADYRPDGLLAVGSGPFVGNNIYNANAAGQTRSEQVSLGHTTNFRWQVQNDGANTDTVTLKGGSSSPKFTVAYFYLTRNVTKAIVNGSYSPQLTSGGSLTIDVKVTVLRTAALKSVRSISLTATSKRVPSKRDAVLATVTAIR